MAKKELSKVEREKRNKYQRERYKKRKALKKKAPKKKKSVRVKKQAPADNTTDLVSIVQAYQLLMGSTKMGQVKAELSKCFTDILKERS